LSAALAKRDIAVALATDRRATRYGGFPAEHVHVIPSATLKGKGPLAYARTGIVLGLGVARALMLLGRLKPKVVVGFGGYPTIPPVLAAAWRGIPTVIHDANAVMGRANRLLAPRVTAIAVTFEGVLANDPQLAKKATVTGNPVRPAVVQAAIAPYELPEPESPFRLLVFGGSQGARVMADIVPSAIALLAPDLRAKLSIVQQARQEDLARVIESYALTGVSAEVAPFFNDLPERMAAAHLIISRSGASTVAELAAIGRPALLVPLPHALDQDQRANAAVLAEAGGAILLTQDAFTPDRLAAELTTLLAAPKRLATMAVGANSVGRIDAAERLAALVLRVAGLNGKGTSQS
jgi:UDP-N-acetylglucosamine--N-acetylmuramyl-(pentapeptide) pyrophosphoryl-undecaprenol N-acetylglucosamine transferase